MTVVLHTIHGVDILSTDTPDMIHEKFQAKNKSDLDIIGDMIINDLDENGDTIRDKFPFLIEIDPGESFLKKTDDGLLEWLDQNIGENFVRHWVTKVYFKNEEDAVWFKLTWG